MMRAFTPLPTLPLKGGGAVSIGTLNSPSPLEGEGGVGGAAGET